jgi:cytochrome c2
MITAVLLSVVGLAGIGRTAGLDGDQEYHNGIDTETTVAMMGYGMMGHGMMGYGTRSPMHHEMTSGRFPQGLSPESLPDPDSRGARVLAHYCRQCHKLPSPAMHTPEEWPLVAARMFGRMRRMSGHGGMGVRSPTPPEREILVAYLQRHAIAPADLDAIESSDSPGPTLFQRVCSGCHHPPDPRSHTAAEWPGVVERMQRHAENMAKPEISNSDRDQIVAFLSERARG